MSLRRRLFSGLARLGTLSEKASRGFLFLGVGLLRKSDLREVSRRSWSEYHATDQEIHSGLTEWEATTFSRYVGAGQRVCIVGCGSGRLVLAFASAGHDVVGVEPSPKPVARLRRILDEDHRSATVIDVEIENAILPGQFDVVIFSGNCYSYIQGSEARIAVLRKVGAHLADGGLVFLTYPRRRGDWVNRSARLTTLAAAISRSDWRPEPFDAFLRLEVPGEPGAIIAEHYFAPEEIEREAQRAGLRVHVHGEPWANAYAVLGF